MESQLAPYPYPYSQAARLDPRITLPRPVIDACLVPLVDAFLMPEELNLAMLRGFDGAVTVEHIKATHTDWTHSEHAVPASTGHTISLSVFKPSTAHSILPVLFFVHGGGMVSGDRFSNIPSLMDLVQELPCAIASIEYRLAPETPAPGGAEDCFDGIVWLSSNAAALGVDAARIIVCGSSGGAPLSAAACMMIRDRQVSIAPIKAQMLLAPMLDDRGNTLSDQQFEYGTMWNGATNRAAWNHALAGQRGTNRVTAYQVPARATDLSHLPQAYIDAAECELFRDQAVDFATNMWRSGSSCELHIWPGGIHLFDAVNNPEIPVVGAAIAAKRAWLMRMMSPS